MTARHGAGWWPHMDSWAGPATPPSFWSKSLQKNSKDTGRSGAARGAFRGIPQVRRCGERPRQGAPSTAGFSSGPLLSGKVRSGAGAGSQLSRGTVQGRAAAIPMLLDARLEMARSLIAAKDPKGALDLLNAAPEWQRNSPVVLVQRNWALWAEGDMAEMRKGIDAGLAQVRSPDLLLQDGIWKLRSGRNPVRGTGFARGSAQDRSEGCSCAFGAPAEL